VIARATFITLCTVVAVWLFSVPAWAEEVQVRATLVADVERLQNGVPFRLGVLLEPEPGWHVYWRNPGGAGLATEVLFELPAGLRAGELQWPTPVFFTQPGDIDGYGYESDVVLAAEVTVSAGVGRSFPVRLDVSWLACKDVCVLGGAELEARVPLADDIRQVSMDAFRGWRDVLPVPPGPERLGLTVTGLPIAESGPSDITVWLSWADDPGAVELFPDPGPGLRVERVRTGTRGRLSRVDLTIKRLKQPGTSASVLPAVVSTTDGNGRRRGFQVSIQLDDTGSPPATR
jgi:thiol:disulfide interchange protein DsbD